MRRNDGEKSGSASPGNGARAGMGASFVRHLAVLLGCSSMKSSFQINVTYSAGQSGRRGSHRACPTKGDK